MAIELLHILLSRYIATHQFSSGDEEKCPMLDKLTISRHPPYQPRRPLLYVSHVHFQFHNHYFGTAAVDTHHL